VENSELALGRVCSTPKGEADLFQRFLPSYDLMWGLPDSESKNLNVGRSCSLWGVSSVRLLDYQEEKIAAREMWLRFQSLPWHSLRAGTNPLTKWA
jgi:hypothetical protein